MKAHMENYLQQGIVSFAFSKIQTVMKNGEEKKEIKHLPSWRHITKENCMNYTNGTALALVTGKSSNLTVLDFDDVNEYERMCTDCPELKKYKTVKTNNGFHVYFKYTAKLTTTTDGFKTYKNIDVRNDNGIIFAPPTQYKLLSGETAGYIDQGGELMEVPQFILNLEQNNNNKRKRDSDEQDVERQTNVKDNVKDEKMIKAIEAGLLDKQNDDYDSWLKCGLAFYNSFGEDDGFEYFELFSKRSSHCDSVYELKNKWSTFGTSDPNKITIKTVHMWMRETNQMLYNEIFKPYNLTTNDIERGPLCVAEVIAPKLQAELKWSNQRWYMCHKNTWTETKQPTYIITKVIRQHVDEGIQSILNQKRNTPDTDIETIKQLESKLLTFSKSLKQMDNQGFTGQISKHLQQMLRDDLFYLKLDNTPYSLAFTNGIFDLKTYTFCMGHKPEDYITKTIPFDYVPSTDEDQETVLNVLFKICNCNPIHLDYYLACIGQALLGDAELEKALYFCVGNLGNNGKTTILESLAHIMPNYVGKLDRKTLEKGYTKAHKHLAGTKGKRVVYIEELGSKELDIELMKEIADGKTIQNEIMFGTDETISITYKLFILSNQVASFKTDGGVGNRYRQFDFQSTFNTNRLVENDDYENKLFSADRTLAQKLKNEYKMALLEVFMKAGHAYTKQGCIEIPEDFKLSIQETLESNDFVKQWFNDNCELGLDFRTSKADVERSMKRKLKDFQGDLQRITGIKYTKNLRFNNGRGGWVGFKINDDNDEEFDRNEF